jgi:acyl-CoA reductase-like NAD-dependent aldehyde dehydrogenase
VGRARSRWARREILDRLAKSIIEHNDDIARLETVDNGSLLLGNTKRVIRRGAHNIQFFADWARQLRPDVIAGERNDNHVRYDPAGVAALIVPWNAPFMLGTWKIGPALAAGDTVVVKPPEWAPLTLGFLGRLALDAGMPPGVLNIVQGIGEDAGAALVAHPGISRISFTGSPETATLIAVAAAPNLTPVSFELGGKSAFLVFADADLDAAAREICGQFVNAGQVCLAGTRLLVDSRIADDLFERVLETLPKFPVGDPLDVTTRVGPLIHRDHFTRVQGFVDRALGSGAHPMLGGRPHPRGGLWFEPTILGDVAQESEIVQNEVFGPVLTWQTFTTESEAIEMANDTPYGLAATLYTHDAERIERVGGALVAGTVWVNSFFVRDLAAPFGGSKRSGIGREGGTWSFDFFCDVKNLSVRRPAA